MAAGARGAPRPAWASPARCGSEGPTGVQSAGGSCVTFRPPGRSTAQGGARAVTPRPTPIAPSEITPPEVYFSRRTLLAAALASAASGCVRAAGGEPAGAPLAYERNARYSVSEKPNTYDEITTYNNFYEFGTDKESPSEYARMMRTRPWSVTVAGEAEVRGRFDLEDLLKGQPLEERIYRFRCVEAWSLAAPHEYGFYANVNPAVDHPRWSQATERRLGSPFLAARRPTLPFNGYAAEVASLYQGMDLRRYF